MGYAYIVNYIEIFHTVRLTQMFIFGASFFKTYVCVCVCVCISKITYSIVKCIIAVHIHCLKKLEQVYL